MEAAIERREGIVVDWARSAASVYANARPVLRTGLPIAAAVESVAWKGGRDFEVVFRWEATEPLPAELTPFAHFVDGRGRIKFQADQQPPRLGGRVERNGTRDGPDHDPERTVARPNGGAAGGVSPCRQSPAGSAARSR